MKEDTKSEHSKQMYFRQTFEDTINHWETNSKTETRNGQKAEVKGELFKLRKEMEEKDKIVSEMRNKLQDAQGRTDSDENNSH